MIEQHPNESAKAYSAYLCYRDLGLQRTIAGAYAIYRKSTTKLVRPSASFLAWRAEFDWDKRVKVWDEAAESAARDRQRAIDDENYQAELEQFRQIQLNAGKQGTAIVLNLKTRLMKWVETHPTITNWTEALIAARIIATLEGPSAEQWAKALHIDLLLDQMMDDSETV